MPQQRALNFYSGMLYAAWVYKDHVHTILWDGSDTRGYPLLLDPKFQENSRNLGYGNDPYWHMIEHDLLHSWIAEQLSCSHSVALWNQAHDPDAWLKEQPEDARLEEDQVAAVQSALNGQEWGLERLQQWVPQDRARDLVRRADFWLRHCIGGAMTSKWAEQKAREIVS